MAFEHLCTHIGNTSCSKIRHCLLKFPFLAKRENVDGLTDVVSCLLKLNSLCSKRHNKIELSNNICAIVFLRDALIRLKPTVQKTSLVGDVQMQPLVKLVFVLPINVSAHHKAVKQFDYVAKTNWV